MRFLPVEIVNSPENISRNREMITINGAMSIDLAGQVIADTIEGRQFSGIGGHATLVRGSPALRSSIEPFQPQAPALAALSRRLKENFDPKGILNPGRMAAGV